MSRSRLRDMTREMRTYKEEEERCCCCCCGLGCVCWCCSSNSDREGRSPLRRADNALDHALPLWVSRVFGSIEQGVHCNNQGVEVVGDHVFHDGLVDVEVFVD